MPQMSPMLWLMISLYMFTTTMLMNCLIFTVSNYKKNSIKFNFTMNNWSW
uniref:ATP synthase F0 subunit 8 n=1 Tax=Elateroidea sp. 8 KM-2017 TaxID=2219431 RepID=A0A346RHF6_9COLE|nr:ATP synthase F0 subunit 8 [Elateroidea sp. 8 KM-2017]